MRVGKGEGVQEGLGRGRDVGEGRGGVGEGECGGGGEGSCHLLCEPLARGGPARSTTSSGPP